MKKLILLMMMAFASLVATTAQQYEYKLNTRTGKPDMVTKAQNIDMSGYVKTNNQNTASIFAGSNYFTIDSEGTRFYKNYDGSKYMSLGCRSPKAWLYITDTTIPFNESFINCVRDASSYFRVTYNGSVTCTYLLSNSLINAFGAINTTDVFSVNDTRGLTATRTFNETNTANTQYRVNSVTITGGIITGWTQGTWTNH